MKSSKLRHVMYGASAAAATVLTLVSSVHGKPKSAMPEHITWTIHRYNWVQSGSSWYAGIPNDDMFGMRGYQTPAMYFDYFPAGTGASYPTYIQVCRQSWSSSTSSCGTTTQNNASTVTSQDVSFAADGGVWSPSNSKWDYYYINAWGAGLQAVYGAGIQGYAACW